MDWRVGLGNTELCEFGKERFLPMNTGETTSTASEGDGSLSEEKLSMSVLIVPGGVFFNVREEEGEFFLIDVGEILILLKLSNKKFKKL